MTAAQNMHMDLMLVLYVYSRVIQSTVGEGGQVHVCICDILDIYKTHALNSDDRGACRYVYGVQGYIQNEATRGSGENLRFRL